jgi:ankyrin repeat protein
MHSRLILLLRFMLKKTPHLLLAIWVFSAHAGSYEDFFRAIERDEAAPIEALIARGFDANSLSPKGQSGLFMAMNLGHFSAARALLSDPQLRVDEVNAVGETALMMAALKGHLEWCQRLVHLGAAVRRTGWTPLHYAASAGLPSQVAVIEFLMLSGAQVDAESPNGTTPLMLAAMYGSEASVRALLAHGASTKRRNLRDLNAVDFARLAGRDKLAEALQRFEPPAPTPPANAPAK